MFNDDVLIPPVTKGINMKKYLSVILASALSVLFLASCTATVNDGKNYVTAPPNLVVSDDASADELWLSTYDEIYEEVPTETNSTELQKSLDEAKINSLIRGDEDLQKQIATAKDSYKDIYKDVKAYAEGTTLIYEYDFVKTLSAEECAKVRGKMEQDLSSESNIKKYSGIASKLRDIYELKSPKVALVYKNGDGSVVLRKEYEPDTPETTTEELLWKE